jgi:hypothetical protein
MTLQNDARLVKRRRMRILVGAAGSAVVLGGAAYLVTAQVLDRREDTVTRNAEAPAPLGTPSSAAAPSVAAASTAPAHQTKTASPKAGVPSSPTTSYAAKGDVERAREAAERDGHPVLPALGAAAAEGQINQRDEPRKNGTLRVLTAKSDLTGQGPLLWAADRGSAVGDARCTQNFHFSNKAKAAVQPNLLLCWRTSAARSVVTVLVDYDGHPSTADSLKIIDREWAKL